MKRDLFLSICIIAAFAGAIAPTLTWMEFSNSSENLVLGTAQEVRRGAPWMAPTLHGELRWQKPPVTTWIIAGAIRPRTMDQIASQDRATRHAGFTELAREIRWPPLAAACLTLLGIFVLGTTLAGSRIGLLATAVAASSFFMLRFSRLATTDIFLALWVTWANVLIAAALLTRMTWTNCIAAGALLGAAIMTKGPVALAQTIAPFAAYALWLRYAATPSPDDRPLNLRRGPLIAGIVAMLVTGVPWWIYVITQIPNAVMRLQAEMTGVGMPDTPDPWYSYFFIIAYVLPYTAFFVVATIQLVIRLAHRSAGPMVLAGILCFLPMFIMVFFRERHDRYLLPMLGPASIMIALALREHLAHWRAWNRGDRVLVAIHWLGMAVLITLFLLGASRGNPKWMTRLDTGQPWFSLTFAISLLATGWALIAIGAFAYLRWRGALVTFTLVIALAAQWVVMLGYPASEAGCSDMRPLADAVVDRYPDSIAYNAHPRPKRPPSDISVYMNRQAIWIAHPSQIKPTDRPTVLLILQNAGEPEPHPPPGWTFIAKAPKRHDWWYAYVLPAIK